MNDMTLEQIFSSCACIAVQKNLFDSFPFLMDSFYEKCRELYPDDGIERGVRFACEAHRNSAKADMTRLLKIRANAEEAKKYMASDEFISLRSQRNRLADELKRRQEGVSPEVQQEMIALLDKVKTARSELMRSRARDRYTELYRREVSRSEEGGSERIISQIRQLEKHMDAEAREAAIRAYKEHKDDIDERIAMYRKYFGEVRK